MADLHPDFRPLDLSSSVIRDNPCIPRKDGSASALDTKKAGPQGDPAESQLSDSLRVT
jgi:hypothetical protein